MKTDVLRLSLLGIVGDAVEELEAELPGLVGRVSAQLGLSQQDADGLLRRRAKTTPHFGLGFMGVPVRFGVEWCSSISGKCRGVGWRGC